MNVPARKGRHIALVARFRSRSKATAAVVGSGAFLPLRRLTIVCRVVAKKKPSARSESSPTPPKRSRRQSAIDSRIELIDAALDIILQDGIDALRIEDVCERVGVTKGSLYWHFVDRNGLIRESLLEHLRRLGQAQLEALSEAVGSFTTRDEYLVRLAGALVDPFDSAEVESRWQRLELIATSRRDPEMWAIMSDIQQRHQRYLSDLMEMASARGILRSDVDPKALAAMLVAVGMGSNLLPMLGTEGPDAESWSRFVLLMIGTLFPSG